MAAKKPPEIFIELFDKRNSGFILDGTENTIAMEELNCPTIRWIPNEGKKGIMENNARKDVPIRFIKGCDTIDIEEQVKRGFKPNHYEDKIPIEKGYATIIREGNTASLYDYLTSVYYNADAPHRSPTAAKLFKIVQLDKEAEGYNEEDVVRAHAIMFVDGLRIKTGNDKEGKALYKYNEDRISALCALLNVTGETPATQIFQIMSKAKSDSRYFMETVEKFEQTIITEVSHALELNVIKFDDNTAMYFNESKIIKNLGTQKLKKEEKIEQLADYLKTREGNPELTELRAKLDLAKEQALKK